MVFDITMSIVMNCCTRLDGWCLLVLGMKSWISIALLMRLSLYTEARGKEIKKNLYIERSWQTFNYPVFRIFDNAPDWALKTHLLFTSLLLV